MAPSKFGNREKVMASVTNLLSASLAIVMGIILLFVVYIQYMTLYQIEKDKGVSLCLFRWLSRSTMKKKQLNKS